MCRAAFAETTEGGTTERVYAGVLREADLAPIDSVDLAEMHDARLLRAADVTSFSHVVYRRRQDDDDGAEGADALE